MPSLQRLKRRHLDRVEWQVAYEKLGIPHEQPLNRVRALERDAELTADGRRRVHLHPLLHRVARGGEERPGDGSARRAERWMQGACRLEHLVRRHEEPGAREGAHGVDEEAAVETS